MELRDVWQHRSSTSCHFVCVVGVSPVFDAKVFKMWIVLVVSCARTRPGGVQVMGGEWHSRKSMCFYRVFWRLVPKETNQK